MSDLPQIRNGDQKEVMTYEIEAETHFQRKIRKNTNGELRDHICKKMNALVEARMSLIPTYPGSDWRDLPNIVMRCVILPASSMFTFEIFLLVQRIWTLISSVRGETRFIVCLSLYIM